MKKTSASYLFVLLWGMLLLILPAHISLSESESTCLRVQKIIEGQLGQSIVIDAPVNELPDEVYAFSLRPVSVSKAESIARAVYAEEIGSVQESNDDHYLSYRIPNPKAASGEFNAFASLDIFFRDQSIAFTDYRRNINGDDTAQWNVPNCNLTPEDAVEQVKTFLEGLGVHAPQYIDGNAVRSSDPNGKGYYRLIFTPMYQGLGFSTGVIGGGMTSMPSYPVVSVAISDDGIFSFNGRFLYEAQEMKAVENPLNMQAATDKLLFYINSGLLSNVAPLPVESITLENFAIMAADGSYDVRPVWSFRSDPEKMETEWKQAGMYLMNLFIYADDGSIAAM